jgi:hypothetical protein
MGRVSSAASPNRSLRYAIQAGLDDGSPCVMPFWLLGRNLPLFERLRQGRHHQRQYFEQYERYGPVDRGTEGAYWMHHRDAFRVR